MLRHSCASLSGAGTVDRNQRRQVQRHGETVSAGQAAPAVGLLVVAQLGAGSLQDHEMRERAKRCECVAGGDRVAGPTVADLCVSGGE